MLSSIRKIFGDLELSFAPTPIGAHCIRPIENSIGKTIVVKRANGEERMSSDSRLAPYSKRKSIVEENEWPVLDQALRTPKIRGN